MEETLELRSHHQVDHEHRQTESEAHAAERALHLLLLAAEPPVVSRRPAHRREGPLDVGRDRAEVPAGEVGGDDGDATAVGPSDLGRALDLGDLADCFKRYCGPAHVGDDQVRNVARRVARRFLGAEADVDGSVAAGDVGGDLALHLGAYDLCHLGHAQAVGREAVAVESDLQLGVAALGRRLDVGKPVDRPHAKGGVGSQPLQQKLVEAVDFDLDGGLETEVGRTPEMGGDHRSIAQPFGRRPGGHHCIVAFDSPTDDCDRRLLTLA